MSLEPANFKYGVPYQKDGEEVVVPLKISKEKLIELGANIDTLKMPFRMNDLLTELNKPIIENGDLWYYLPEMQLISQ